MNGGCHCGAVTIRVAARPGEMNLCNCSVCFKLGTMWGYYPPADVTIDGAPRAYARVDVAAPRLLFHFCETCGATTHWSYADPDGPDRMAVNMRLFDPAGLAGVVVRYGDRRAHGRSEPEPSYRDPSIFSASGAPA